MPRRPTNPMPQDVLDRLEQTDLLSAYEARPHYQRNDYLGWIAAAKRSATREKRLRQMLDELRCGGVYMGMDHPPSRKTNDGRG